MKHDPESFHDQTTGVVALLVLGVGLVAMFARIPNFYAIWAIGFAVVVPLVAILTNSEFGSDAESSAEETDSDNPLETLRERYARGELTDEQFEEKLDRLLETETIDDVKTHRATSDPQRERER
ncbi:SHOCT domain-containing protein [Halocatena halophila]|uniref:SHOCT domain-containing protein n=1 Tax=Halocatena halophila TaxID=2814576 RepID=UPI002ED1C60B